MQADVTERWESERLRLFPLTLAGVTDAYVAWLNDPSINRFLESRFAVQTIESVRAFVAGQGADPKSLFLGIHDKALDRHVGNIKLGPIDRHHGLGEIGIMIGDRQAWGRGVASEAIACLAAIAFDDLGLRKLTAGCYAANVGSQRAFQRAGFHVEGLRPRHFILDGQPEDLVLMARHADQRDH